MMTLGSQEFLRRFLLHVLPRGFVRIRSFGFLANRRRAALLPLCQRLLADRPTGPHTRPRHFFPHSAHLFPLPKMFHSHAYRRKGRLRWLPLFGIRQKTSSAIIFTFVSNINSTSPRPSTPIQSCNASTLLMQGKGGSYSNSRDARVAPLRLHPIPPKAQIFTDRLRSHCCGNLLSKSLGLSNCKAIALRTPSPGRSATPFLQRPAHLRRPKCCGTGGRRYGQTDQFNEQRFLILWCAIFLVEGSGIPTD
jgi:Putative transposase